MNKNTQLKLSKQAEEFREEVVQSELIARANKAEYERMHYYLLAKEIAPKFLEAIEEQKAEKEKLQADFEKQLKDQIAEQNSQSESISEPPSIN